jgi:hypothetical protein
VVVITEGTLCEEGGRREQREMYSVGSWDQPPSVTVSNVVWLSRESSSPY